MRVRFAVTLFGLCFTACVLPLLAHHSVAAQYDIDKVITVRGVVTKTEWMNPHARFWVDAKNDDGTVANWEMELAPPNTLKRQGVTRDSFKQGDPVTVDVWRAKDGSRLGHALTLTLPGGQILQFPRGLGWRSPGR
ncbi:MAG: DUF6152 family protein [Acidobacteriota bacterium]